MSFLMTRVTLHVRQVHTFLLGRCVSIASIHDRTRMQLRAIPFDVPDLVALVTGPLVTTGWRSIAGFTWNIVIAARRARSFSSIKRQLCRVPFYLLCNVTGTPDRPVSRTGVTSRQLLLHLCAQVFSKSI
jgi:hypothetical protein